MTVRQLLANLDARELLEWQAFFELERERNAKDQPDSPDVTSENVKLALEGMTR